MDNKNHLIDSYSWTIQSAGDAIKKMDKSSFLHNGTVIPQEIRSFFSVDDLIPGKKVPITLWFQHSRFEAHVEMTVLDHPRTRLMWRTPFSNLIQSLYPKCFDFFNNGGNGSESSPSIKFSKRQQPSEFNVEFIDPILFNEKVKTENYFEPKRNFWWVNQNQTYAAEVQGGFLWSPQTKNNGGQNPFYDFMLKVEPGDLIFSFCDTKIKALGIARSKAFEYEKPFKDAGKNWTREGWKILVHFKEIPIENQIKPSEFFEHLKNHLSAKYSPLNRNGEGCQGIYLTTITEPFAKELLSLIGEAGKKIISEFNSVVLLNSEEIESQQVKDIEEKYSSGAIPDTERDQLSKARVGQGKFRLSVVELEKKCRVTNVAYPKFLRASHIKPWSQSTNQERLDGNNGLLLSPHFDYLFDKGFITFSNDGDIILSSKLPKDIISLWNFSDRMNVGKFREKQYGYLEFHRKFVFQS